MKLYDEIFIPDEEQGVFLITKERMEDSAPVHVAYASKEESVIVLTLEELREAIKDGYDEGRDSSKNDWDDFKAVFEQFCKRKGLNTIP